MGKKYQKLCHNPTVHFPQEREGSLMAKSLNLLAKNIVRLNHTHLFLHPFMSKIFKLCLLANFQQIIQISCNSPQNSVNDAKFAPFIDPLYINAFRFLTIGRELSEIPANRPDFVHFAHSSCELCKIRTIRTNDQ